MSVRRPAFRSDECSANFLKGTLDELRIYTRALTQAEIKPLMTVATGAS